MSEFFENLPEDLRDNEHLSTFQDAGQLAQAYVKTKTTPFHENLDDDVKNEVKDFKTPADLAKAYVETKAKVPVVPESADKYVYEIPESLRERVDEAGFQAFREAALKNGLSQKQFEAMMNFDIARVNATLERYDSERKEAVSKVAGELSKTDDEVSGTVEKIVSAHESLQNLSKKVDLASDPDFLRFAMWLSSAVGEDTLYRGGSGANQRPMNDDGRPRMVYKSMGDS